MRMLFKAVCISQVAFKHFILESTMWQIFILIQRHHAIDTIQNMVHIPYNVLFTLFTDFTEGFY